jgi:hypothetical protein
MKTLSTAKHNFSRSTTFVFIVSPSEILPYHYTTKLHNLFVAIHRMDSFGINNIKSCDAYFDIHMISNQKKLNYKIVHLVEYYNFGIKFVLIGQHM